MARAGSTVNGCNPLARKEKPIAVPARSSHRVDAESIARVTQYAAVTMSSVIKASGLLKRNIKTATGVTASSAPAIRPAQAPNHRLTAAYSSHTDSTPSRACGASIDHELNPKIRPDSSMTQSDAGGLSTVMKFDESNDPNRNAFQLFVPAWTAAA